MREKLQRRNTDKETTHLIMSPMHDLMIQVGIDIVEGTLRGWVVLSSAVPPPVETFRDLKCHAGSAVVNHVLCLGTGEGNIRAFHSAAMADLILPLDPSQRHFGGYVEAMVRRVYTSTRTQQYFTASGPLPASHKSTKILCTA